MPRRRDLHPEEQELWQSVARTVTPIAGRAILAKPAPAPMPPVPGQQPAELPPPAPKLPTFRLGEKPAPKVPRPADHPLRMDAKTHARMTRGKLSPESRIDLHGMTVAEAHAELVRFILNAQESGFRLVLVITGKGKSGREEGHPPRQGGVLRHQMPHWLRLPPLGSMVQQVAEAHLRHGGAGAFYVYLRRR